ncbi:MAG: hypothetical protein ABUK13_07980, partial [Gammaproteobacteria bacterium]
KARREVDKQIKAMMENTGDEFHENLDRAKVRAKYNEAVEKARAEQERKKRAYLRRQAELKKKAAEDSKPDSDPCSGKSARFLSTCR